MLDDPESQSPDIGPPPVSRFDDQDPISFDPSPIGEETAEQPGNEHHPALSVNLETRRKRRESGPRPNVRRVAVFESPTDESEEKPKPVRLGAKRKFSVQEDAERPASESDNFTYSKKNIPGLQSTENTGQDTRSRSPERPVLCSSELFSFRVQVIC